MNRYTFDICTHATPERRSFVTRFLGSNPDHHLCQDQLSVLHPDTYDIRIYAIHKGTDQIRGFLFADRRDEYIVIELLCSNGGVGRYLVNRLIRFARRNRVLALCTNSIESAKGFYVRLGFEAPEEDFPIRGMNMILEIK